MLEFFTVAYYANTENRRKNKEDEKIRKLFNNEEDIQVYVTEKSLNIELISFLAGLIALVIALFSAKLSYFCNAQKSEASQVMAVLFAFFFPGFYLTYYFIWHNLLGNKC